METFSISLNIHYSAPQEIWDGLSKIYREMPHWNENSKDGASWYGEDGKIIQISVEPVGLCFYAELPAEEWKVWIEEFKKKASALVGYEVGEVGNGYECKVYDDEISAEEWIEELKESKKKASALVGYEAGEVENE